MGKSGRVGNKILISASYAAPSSLYNGCKGWRGPVCHPCGRGAGARRSVDSWALRDPSLKRRDLLGMLLGGNPRLTHLCEFVLFMKYEVR